MFVSLPHQLLLIGDFSIDFLVPTSSLYFKLQSIASSFNLTQIVYEPICVCKASQTLIDLILYHLLFLSKKNVQPYLLLPIQIIMAHCFFQTFCEAVQTHDKKHLAIFSCRLWPSSRAAWDGWVGIIITSWTLTGQHGKHTFYKLWKLATPMLWPKLRLMFLDESYYCWNYQKEEHPVSHC